jgi:V8-like Glu-specific endopeptidase
MGNGQWATGCGGIMLSLAIIASIAAAAIYDRQGCKIPDREVNSDRVDWQLLNAQTGKKYNGVGLIEVDYGVCTGFAIAIGNHPQSPAYILTNAHCQGPNGRLPGAQDIIVNRRINSNFVVNYFHDFKAERLSMPIKKIVYATMKNNDIAILELYKTQQEAIAAGIQPLKISPHPPTKGEEIAVVGIPSEGVKPKLNFLHKSRCKIGKIVTIAESVYYWQKSIEHRCSIVGGMSGSPMISRKHDRVVGIVNTGVDDKAIKQPECSLNRPCEVGKDGQRRTFPQENYGQLIHHITTCFNSQGVFNLYQPGCQLEKPK